MAGNGYDRLPRLYKEFPQSFEVVGLQEKNIETEEDLQATMVLIDHIQRF